MTVQPLHTKTGENVSIPPSGRAFPDAIDGTGGRTSTESEQAIGETSNEEEAPTRLEQLIAANTDELMKSSKEKLNAMADIEAQRKELNADNQAIREQFESLGIGKKALDTARKVIKMNEKDRDGFWLALQILLKAGGVTIKKDELQMELFE